MRSCSSIAISSDISIRSGFPKTVPASCAPIVEALVASADVASFAQPRPCGDDDFDAARSHARARAVCARAWRRAGAGERAARRRARAPLRGGGRDFVSRIHRGAARAGRRRPGRRGADPRRGQRRRSHDDRAQGQGARVSRRHSRRHDREIAPRFCEPVYRFGSRHVRDSDCRLFAVRSDSARAGRARARRGRRSAACVRRRHPCARSAGRAGGGRRGAGRVDRADESGDLSADGSETANRPLRPDVPRSNRRTRC